MAKLYPRDIEQLVSSIDGYYKGHCLAGHTISSTEEMIVAVETNICNEVEERSAQQMYTQQSQYLGLFAVRICLLKPGIPRTNSKYQRLLLRDNHGWAEAKISCGQKQIFVIYKSSRATIHGKEY